MGKFADVKWSKLIRIFKWLKKKPRITIYIGGSHQYAVKHSTWERPFPLPINHNTINKYIFKDFVDKLVQTGVCTEDEIKDRL